MGDDPLPAAATAPSMTVLLHPTTLILVAANAVPIVGVLYWQWDAFLLLMLYWLESAIIGFWTMARIVASAPGSMGALLINGHPATKSPLAMAAFFLVHAGGFMAVHMALLWTIFAGDWSSSIHGPRDFIANIVVATGLWLPLLVLFVSRGASFLFHVLKPDVILTLERLLPVGGLPPPPPPGAGDGAIIGVFYFRIVIMQVAILLGGVIASIFGSLAPLVILIVLKTAVDVCLHLVIDFGVPAKRFAPALAFARTSRESP